MAIVTIGLVYDFSDSDTPSGGSSHSKHRRKSPEAAQTSHDESTAIWHTDEPDEIVSISHIISSTNTKILSLNDSVFIDSDIYGSDWVNPSDFICIISPSNLMVTT